MVVYTPEVSHQEKVTSQATTFDWVCLLQSDGSIV